jgi:hypothetical protein
LVLVEALAAHHCAGFAPKLLLTQLPQAGGFLLLTLHARLFVVFAAAGLREDAVLLNALVEALQGAFERLVIADDDFCQVDSPRLLALCSREFPREAHLRP